MSEFAHRAESRFRHGLRRARERVLGAKMLRSAVLPFILVGAGIALAACLPSTNWLRSDAAEFVGPLAQAQGAIAAISLAVMVLIVEAVQRREDIVDATYDVFLRKAHVRCVISSVLVWTLGTVIAFVLSQISSFEEQDNLAIFATASIAITVLAILHFTQRALDVLRPGRYREFKRVAYLDRVNLGLTIYMRELKKGVDDEQNQIVRSIDEVDADQAMERLLHDIVQAMGDQRTVDVQANMHILKRIIQCATKILDTSGYAWTSSNEAFRGGVPVFGILRYNMSLLWRTAYESKNHEYVNQVHSLLGDLEILFDIHKNGELFHLWMSCVVSSYQPTTGWREEVADSAGRAWHSVIMIIYSRLPIRSGVFISDEQASQIRFIAQYFHNCASQTVESDDPKIFRRLIAEFREAYEVLQPRGFVYSGELPPVDLNIDKLLQYIRLTLSTLAGGAIALQNKGQIADSRPFVDCVAEVFGAYGGASDCLATIERSPAIVSDDPWEKWDPESDDESLIRQWRPFMPDRYPVLYFITTALIHSSRKPRLKTLGTVDSYGLSIASQYWGSICDVAQIPEKDRPAAWAQLEQEIVRLKELDRQAAIRKIAESPLDEDRTNQLQEDVIEVYHEMLEQVDDTAISALISADRVDYAQEQSLGLPKLSNLLRCDLDKRLLMGVEAGGAIYMSPKEIISSGLQEAITRLIAEPMPTNIEGAVSGIDDPKVLMVAVGNALAEVQPKSTLFLFRGTEAMNSWMPVLNMAHLHLGVLKSRMHELAAERIRNAWRSGHHFYSAESDAPTLSVINLARAGVLRRADIDGMPVKVEIKEIDAARTAELRRFPGLELEVTARIEFVLEDADAVASFPLGGMLPVTSEEIEVNHRIESDPFTTQEGRNDA